MSFFKNKQKIHRWRHLDYLEQFAWERGNNWYDWTRANAIKCPHGAIKIELNY